MEIKLTIVSDVPTSKNVVKDFSTYTDVVSYLSPLAEGEVVVPEVAEVSEPLTVDAEETSTDDSVVIEEGDSVAVINEDGTVGTIENEPSEEDEKKTESSEE